MRNSLQCEQIDAMNWVEQLCKHKRNQFGRIPAQNGGRLIRAVRQGLPGTGCAICH